MINIKKVVGANITENNRGNGIDNKKNYDIDMSNLGIISDGIKVVLFGCNLMKYLVAKAKDTGYLSHQERLSILYVFGHLGDEGKDFVHVVMGFTMNYQYHVTQKFILKMPAKPVSCIKLREQYKMITAEYGCSCMFKRTKDCYPSPVIHAIRDNNSDSHDITIPTSRTISKEKQNHVYDELNIHVRVQELASKIVELKKQQRGIEKSVKKVEQDLAIIYDNARVDCMEIDMGMLVRKRTDSGWSWTIDF